MHKIHHYHLRKPLTIQIELTITITTSIMLKQQSSKCLLAYDLIQTGCCIRTLTSTRCCFFFFFPFYFFFSARRKDTKVKGYFAWSLLNKFEWNFGYTVRFDINYVDYNNELKRYLKNPWHTGSKGCSRSEEI